MLILIMYEDLSTHYPRFHRLCDNATMRLFHHRRHRNGDNLENEFFSDANQVIWRWTSSNVSTQERDVALTLHQWPRPWSVIGILGDRFLENNCAIRWWWAFADSVVTSEQPCIWMVVVCCFVTLLAFVLKEEGNKVSVNQFSCNTTSFFRR